MTAPCPRCGHNFVADRPIERGAWRIDPLGVIEYGGQRHRIRATWAAILHCICSRPGFVSTEALLNRVSNSDNRNTVVVTISQMKRWLQGRGIPLPIKGTRHGAYAEGGYVWCG